MKMTSLLHATLVVVVGLICLVVMPSTMMRILGGGLGIALLFFPITYLSLKKQLNLRFSKWKIFYTFFLSAIAIGTATAAINPENNSVAEMLCIIALPLTISACVIFVFSDLSNKKGDEP